MYFQNVFLCLKVKLLENENPAFVRRADARLFLSILAAGLLSFTGVVIETAMNVTFPTLMEEFSVSTSTVQWLTTGYLLVLATVIPTSSYLKQRFPLKGLFVAGNLLFLTGTVLDGLAGNFPLLLLGRLLQGAGTGIGLPLMFNLVLEQAPLDKIGTMMGAAMLVCALAPAVGPSLGGFIIGQFGWRMIFAALVPGLLFSLAVGICAIRQSSAWGPRPFDGFGLGCLMVALPCLLLLCSYGTVLPAPALLALTGLMVLAMAVFVRQENRLRKLGSTPLLNLQVFQVPAFDGAVLGLLLVQFLCLGVGFLLPNYAQIVLGSDPFAAGCILLPGCLLGAALAPVSGRLYDRLGARKPLILGSCAIILSFGLYQLALGKAAIPGLTAIYVVFTLGQGLSAGNILTYALENLPESIQPDGNAVCNTLQQLAGAVGTSVCAALVAAGQAGRALAQGTSLGTAHAFHLLLILALCQGACMVWALGKNRQAVSSH